MSNDVRAEQNANGWTFRFGDPLVTQLQIDYRFTLLLGGGALIVLESPFELRRRQAVVRVPPGDDVSEVGEALPLFNARVDEVKANTSGELRIDFGNEVVATVAVRPTYESWQIVMPDGEQWIGKPGGGVAHLPAR